MFPIVVISGLTRFCIVLDGFMWFYVVLRCFVWLGVVVHVCVHACMYVMYVCSRDLATRYASATWQLELLPRPSELLCPLGR